MRAIRVKVEAQLDILNALEEIPVTERAHGSA